MSIEAISELEKRVLEVPELFEAMKKATSSVNVVNLAKDQGFSFTAEVLEQAVEVPGEKARKEIVAFEEKVVKDSELQRKLRSAREPGEVVRIAAETGHTFTERDLIHAAGPPESFDDSVWGTVELEGGVILLLA
jgi:predicted ribosomally synthesized peptide with nif11-like leader